MSPATAVSASTPSPIAHAATLVAGSNGSVGLHARFAPVATVANTAPKVRVADSGRVFDAALSQSGDPD